MCSLCPAGRTVLTTVTASCPSVSGQSASGGLLTSESLRGLAYPAPVDEARLRFLFGAVPGRAGTEDERAALLLADRPGSGGAIQAFRTVIANQVLDGTPPDTWTTAQRLQALGLGRHETMDQLVGALRPFVEAALHDQRPFDPRAYADELARLPAVGGALDTYLDVLRERVAAGADELRALVVARLDLDPEAPSTAAQLDAVEGELLEDPDSPVTMLAPDVFVHVPAIADGIVLTHRLTAQEQAAAYLDLDADLAAFVRFPEPRVGDEPLEFDDDTEPVAWVGPEGWLADLPEGALLSVRVAGEGDVTISVLDAAPVAPPGLVDLLRAAYDAEVEEPWLPVTGEDLVAAVLHRDRAAFAGPRPPLTELAVAAGLEQRGHEFAHEESVWEAAADADRQFGFMHRLDTAEQVEAAEEAFQALLRPDDPAGLRGALDWMEDPGVLTAVVDRLLDPDGDEARVAALVALATRLVAAAGRTPRAAVAGWIAAVAAERDGRVLDAESHLRAASVAADGWPMVEDRLAWYESDRGDAAAALGRWVGIEAPDEDPDVAIVARFAAAAGSGPEPGRNEPCWCGSGRKFKQCHRGVTASAPLPDRVGWLCRKAIAYLERRGGAADELLERHADVLAGERGELDAAHADPLVLDTVLHEGGWFARFLADRGPLLPADEAELAASWLPVERSVYEVTGVDGAGLTARDLRTGAALEVAAPGRTVVAGERLCARAVPDGTGHQFVGAVFDVPPGHVAALLEVLSERDGLELLEWVAAADDLPLDAEPDADPGPPASCTTVLRVPATARAALGRHYPANGAGGWICAESSGAVLGEMELDGDELTLRARSEGRMERLVADLVSLFPDAPVLRQDVQN